MNVRNSYSDTLSSSELQLVDEVQKWSPFTEKPAGVQTFANFVWDLMKTYCV